MHGETIEVGEDVVYTVMEAWYHLNTNPQHAVINALVSLLDSKFMLTIAYLLVSWLVGSVSWVSIYTELLCRASVNFLYV